jgi:hypothetical protein
MDITRTIGLVGRIRSRTQARVKKTTKEGRPNCYSGPAGVQRVKKNESQKEESIKDILTAST